MIGTALSPAEGGNSEGEIPGTKFRKFRGHNTNFAGSQSATDRWACEEWREDSGNLPDPDVLAQEIVEDLEAALEQFREIAAGLGSERVESEKS